MDHLIKNYFPLLVLRSLNIAVLSIYLDKMGSGDASTSLKFATLDVFTTTRFEGNPLALVHLPRDFSITQAQKQAIAREFNFSETVFLHEDVGTSEGRKYDIFTSTQELSFAGWYTTISLGRIPLH